MKIVNEPYEINYIICNAIKKYKYISFAVAWASSRTKAFKLLLEKKENIENCVVGLHFFQTDPKFIEHFVQTGPIKFLKKTQGVFHPKIYLFWNTPTDWIGLIGSANFTNSAMEYNDEVITLIDTNDQIIFNSFKEIIDKYYKQANFLSNEDFIEYKTKRIQKSKMNKKSDNFKNISILDLASIFNLSWDSYYKKLKQTPNFIERLELLTKIKTLFKTKTFKDFNEITRKNIGGVIKEGNSISNWHLFGRMPSSRFANRLKDCYKEISEQLDKLPTDREVTKSEYNDFLSYFKECDNYGYSISTVSRLLAMKLPNQFFCITSANEQGLLEALNLTRSIQKDNKEEMYERYWKEIILSIRNATWNKEKPKGLDEKELLAWDYRAALLDTLLYFE